MVYSKLKSQPTNMDDIKPKHTAEFKEIIEKIPDNFNKIILFGISVFLLVLIVLGIWIKIPGTIDALANVTPTNPPVVLNAQVAGKIRYKIKEFPYKCKKGEYIAIIENTANDKDILLLKEILRTVPMFDNATVVDTLSNLSLSLGEVEASFFNLATKLQEYNMLRYQSSYEIEIALLEQQIKKDSITIVTQEKILDKNKTGYKIKNKIYLADSILYRQKAILEKEYDQAIITKINTENELTSLELEIFKLKQSIIENTLNKENLKIEYFRKIQEAILNVKTALQTLKTAIDNWEKSYTFHSTQAGIVEQVSILPDGSFVSVGDPVFNIIFEDNVYQAGAMLPSSGAGKVQIGQKVNIKLDLYPYQEYGYLEGFVKNITQNTYNTYYFINISLPNGLKSSNGQELAFAKTMHGQAEIITEEKRLIQLVFYHIQKALSRKPKVEQDTEKEESQLSNTTLQNQNKNGNHK